MEYSPRGRNESDTTERLSLSLFQKQEAPPNGKVLTLDGEAPLRSRQMEV